jgi:bla regulator protein blaR1
MDSVQITKLSSIRQRKKICRRKGTVRSMTKRRLRVRDLIRKLPLPVALFAAQISYGQAAPTSAAVDAVPSVPKFEVSTVKASDPSSDGMIRMMFTQDGISYTGIPMPILLREAFNVEDDCILGEPSSIKSNRYDIEAKVEGADVPRLEKLSIDERKQMLLALLIDRFNLKFHHETRRLPVYLLLVAKGGSKLKTQIAAPPGPDGKSDPKQRLMVGRGKMEAEGVPIEALGHMLSQQVGRTVLDKTGLTGHYDFKFQWTPDDAPTPTAKEGDAAETNPNSPEEAAPSLFTALQEQLGLKLESQQAPVDVIVIDHIEPPSAN